MNQTHQKLIDIGTNILTSARNQLYLSMRFLDIALSKLQYEMNLSSLYVGTDGEKILFNPRYLVQRYLSDHILVNRVYLHMILHCLFRHPFHQKDRDEAYWHLACDIAIEYMIDALPYKSVKLVVSDLREEWYEKLKKELKVLSAEGIYQVLQRENLSLQQFGKLQLAFWVDDHVFWASTKDDQNSQQEQNNQQDNSNHQNENPSNQQARPTTLEQQWQEISEKMQTNLETFSKEAGLETGDLLQHLQVENRERYQYHTFLQKFMTHKEDMQVDDDSYDYIFYTYGLQLYGNMPLIEALEYKEVKKIEELVIAIDTSESCEGETIKQFLEQTYAILMQHESFFHQCHIRILQCDTKVVSDQKITSKKELQDYMQNVRLQGNGGTDFRPVFDYVADLIAQKAFHHLKGLLYFTDGWGSFPKKRPPYETAFLFLDDGTYNERDVPPWAIKVVLGKEDFQVTEHKELML